MLSLILPISPPAYDLLAALTLPVLYTLSKLSFKAEPVTPPTLVFINLLLELFVTLTSALLAEFFILPFLKLPTKPPAKYASSAFTSASLKTLAISLSIAVPTRAPILPSTTLTLPVRVRFRTSAPFSPLPPKKDSPATATVCPAPSRVPEKVPSVKAEPPTFSLSI